MIGEQKRIKAVIVGIENYVQSDIPNLDGPALDAARFAEWLYKSGVSKKDIKTFLAPLPKNIEQCRRLMEEINFSPANSQNIVSALNEVIRNSISEILLVFWAGHGCMLSNEQRLLYFPDGSPNVRLCLNFSELILTAAKVDYKNHTNQHFFVDACADFLEPNTSITPVNVLPNKQEISRNLGTTQFTLFSASPGEQAGNLSHIQAGFASNALMNNLQESKFWPFDPSDLFDDTVELMKREAENDRIIQQHPYIMKIYPDSSTSEPIKKSEFLADLATTRVMRNVENVLPEDRVHPAFHYDLEIEDGVSHFRRRSQEALKAAGRVPPSNLNGQHILFEDGLYVKRDLEADVLDSINKNRMVIPVQGAPGAGKTSMLWGIGAECSQLGWDVLFVQAPWLSSADTASNAKTATHLAIAANLSKNSGKSVVVLIDTADALISQDEGLETLVQLVESLNAEQIPVVVTCRPEEAKRMPSSWKSDLSPDLQKGLGDFSVVPSNDRKFSEFEIAVASHAESFKTRTGHPTEFLVHQLANAVSRKKPMSQFCLRPLFLRMLFDLYAPFAVPENLNITMLYEQYWLDRVVNDRRDIDEEFHPQAKDVSNIVMALGREMLQLGMPELRLSSLAKTQELDSILGEIGELGRRGLGETRNGVFSFFHQTFFEFAAAKSLLKESGIKAVCILLERIKEDTGNYFLLAVLEQTWLCAWADANMRHQSMEIAERVLDEFSTNFPSSVRQVTLSIVAQAPVLSSHLWSYFYNAVQYDPFDTFISALRLLPTPSRQSGMQEVLLCKIGSSRSDVARSESLFLLERLTDAEPEKVVKMIGEDFPFVPNNDRELEHSTVQFIVNMLPYEPRIILKIMSKLVRYAIQTHRLGLLELILNEALNHPGKHSRQFADWCNIEFKNAEPKLQILLAKANGFGIECDIDNDEFTHVNNKFNEVLLRIMSSNRDEISQHDRNVFSGTLLAARHPKFQNQIPKIITSILLNNNPRIHSWIHYGLLVPILNVVSIDVQYFIAFQIARGLPASSFNQESGEGRWADTLRRSLARAEIDSNVLMRIAEEVERLVLLRDENADSFWFQTEYFVDIVVGAASAGVVTAQDALHKLETGSVTLDAKVVSQLSDKLKRTGGAFDQKIRSLRILIQFDNINAVAFLIQNITFDGGDIFDIPELSSFIKKYLNHPDPSRRSSGWDLYKISILQGILPWPKIGFYRSEIEKTIGHPPLALIELLELGISKLVYDPEHVKSHILLILKTRNSIFHEKKESALRRVHVRILALTCPATEWVQVLEEALRPPNENSLLVNAASLLVDTHRSHAPLSVQQKLRVLIYVGTVAKARSLSKAATKRAAPAWRFGIGEALLSLDEGDRAKLLISLGDMNTDFAVEIATQLEIRGSDLLREISQRICTDESTDPRVRKALQTVLRETWISSTPRTWLDLQESILNHKSCDLCAAPRNTI